MGAFEDEKTCLVGTHSVEELAITLPRYGICADCLKEKEWDTDSALQMMHLMGGPPEEKTPEAPYHYVAPQRRGFVIRGKTLEDLIAAWNAWADAYEVGDQRSYGMEGIFQEQDGYAAIVYQQVACGQSSAGGGTGHDATGA